METLRIDEITIDQQVQLNARRTDESIVASYVEAMSAGAEFPPVIVFSSNGDHWLADGFHRIAARRFLGEGVIEADIREGNKTDAMVYAATANVANGRPMSAEQKREAGKRLFKLTHWSDREIARCLALNHSTVSRWAASVEISTDRTRVVSRNGKTYQMDVSRIGKPDGALEQFLIETVLPEQSSPIIADIVPSPPELPEQVKLIVGKFQNVGPILDADSFDVIITDPPYPYEYLYLYETLAEQASRLLRDGGSLFAMAGQSYLPDIMAMMTPHLAYHWTLAYLTPGGQSPQIWQRKINAFWKPVLWFVKGEYTGRWVGDVAKSNENDNDKRFHDWGQSESGMADLIRRVSEPGDHILDPFCGGGTTGVVAHLLGRRFTGIDSDETAIETTRGRIAKCQYEMEA